MFSSYFSKFLDYYLHFFKECPLLFYGIYLSLGVGAAIYSYWLFIFLPILSFPIYKNFFSFSSFTIAGSLLSIASFFYTQFLYPTPLDFKDPLEGCGLFHISSISPSTSFEPRLLYKGTLSYFSSKDEKKSLINIPCQIYYKGSEEKRPKADKIYFVEGTLLPMSPYLAIVKPLFALQEKESSHSLGELRFKAKNFFRDFLKKSISDPLSAQFLIALITGDLDENFLKFCFANLGLQHIMAISGFHFGILLSSLSFLLSFIVPRKFLPYILLLFIQIYFLFLGITPSIERAYISSSLFLIGKICNKNSIALNSLGAAVIIELLVEPLHILNMGFQLSFLSTACLLFGSSTFSSLFSGFFPKRTAEIISSYPLYARSLISCQNFLKESLALSFAVNLTVIPVVLFHFNSFPLLCFIYNLFFPFLVAVSIFLSLLLFAFHILLPPLAPLLDIITTIYTKWTLDFVSYPPLKLSYFMHCKEIPFFLLISYLIALLFFFIGFKKFYREKELFSLF